MSIADKLTYLNTTKQLLKTEINKINNVLDDNSTFRSYPQELFNGYLDILNNGTDTLWNNLEKVSASGETPVLENVETAPIKMVLNGNTSQETTSGKNLFNTDYVISANYGTFSYSDGVYTFTPSSTSEAARLVALIPKEVFNENQAYTIKAEGNVNGIAVGYASNANDTSHYNFFGRTIGKNSHTFTYTSVPKNYVNIYFYNKNSTLGTNWKMEKVQLEQGSTATSYEPYTGGQPSPSPDYPQEVKVVKGENVVSVQGKNLFDKDNYNLFNGYVYSNKFVYAWQGYMVYIPCKSNTTYTISRIKLENNFVVSSSVDIPVANGQTTNSVTKNTATSITYKTGVNDKYLEVYVKYYGDSSYSFSEIIDSLQIEEGSTATPYVPYSKTDYPISLGTIEMCKINTYKDYFHKDSGKWYVHKENIKYDLGTLNWIFENSTTTPVNRTVLRLTGTNAKSSYFSNIFDSNKQNDTTVANRLVTNSGYSWYVSLEDSLTGIISSDTNAVKISKIKEYLLNKNAFLITYLLTPTEEEITNTTLIEQLEAISKAKSVKDKTYITQTNDDLPFILDVEAIKEYEVV